MCKKLKGIHNRIDKCMKHWIKLLEGMGWNILACCCGHGKYPTTIVVKDYVTGGECIYELFTEIDIPRKRRFYKKDKQGYYFIPEVIENGKSSRI